MITLNDIASAELGASSNRDLPSSQHLPNMGSNGRDPKNSTSMSAAIFSAPPVVGGNICDWVYRSCDIT